MCHSLHVANSSFSKRDVSADASADSSTCTVDRFDHAYIQGSPAISRATARRLCCDAAIIRVVEDKNGQPLSVGRKSRTTPSAIEYALRARHPSCRFPGCSHERLLHRHHIVHWADGGKTSVDNFVTL